MNKKRRRQTTLKKFRSDANSRSCSINGQESAVTKTYATRNRQGHLNHLGAQPSDDSHRIRLRRSAQRNVNYNEDEVSGADDEASNSSVKRRKIRGHDK